MAVSAVALLRFFSRRTRAQHIDGMVAMEPRCEAARLLGFGCGCGSSARFFVSYMSFVGKDATGKRGG